MMDETSLTSINISNVNLWAHVGVLEKEQLLGQDFLLDIILWVDVNDAAINDELSATLDYSLAINNIQQLALGIKCKTIERFSECILERLENLYGPIPMEISLKKCTPPIDGFQGSVSINRKKNIFP